MATALPVIGAGLQVGQGIGSAVKGQQASQQLSQNMGMTNELFAGMANSGANVMNTLSNAARQYATPNSPGSVFQQGTRGPAVGSMSYADSPAVGSMSYAESPAVGSMRYVGGLGLDTLGATGTAGNIGIREPNPRAPATSLADQILRDAHTAGGGIHQALQGGADALGNRDLANQAAGLLSSGGMGGLLDSINQGGGFQNFTPGQINQGTQFTPLGMHVPGQNGTNITPLNLSPVHQGQAFAANMYNFDPVNSVRQQAVDYAMQAGNNARATATEQAALALSQGGNAIDMMLASRGLGQGSGVGAAALSQLGAAQGQQMTELNRAIADQTQQAALAGAQFDVGSLLEMAGLGSQYNLGMNQLTGQLGLGRDQMIASQLDSRNALTAQHGMAADQLTGNLGAQRDALIAQQIMAQNDLMGNLGLARDQMVTQQMMQNTQLASQFGLQQNDLLAGLAQAGQTNDLARSQQLGNLQGLRDQSILAQADLRSRSYSDPLSIMQGVYSQNYLAPQMELLGLQSGLAGTLIGSGVQGLMGNQAAMAQAVQSAGAGKGAATAGATRSGKGGGKNSPTPVSLANPGIQVAYNPRDPLMGYGRVS